jgi:hypothetical protein
MEFFRSKLVRNSPRIFIKVVLYEAVPAFFPGDGEFPLEAFASCFHLRVEMIGVFGMSVTI